MKRFFRFIAAVLAAAFLFSLTGCGGSSSAASFTWFVDTIPTNLDPQVASAASDVIACENLYSGLVRKNSDGEIVPDLAESWTVSPDGKTYTFQLKDDLTYRAVKGASTDYAITAEDFVFAFRRIFQPQTNSPYAVEFSALENSAAVLAGEADASTLGVSASGPLTLVFRLSEKDDNFLSKLTLPGAMPCDEEFFDSTRGTYGLTAKTTLSSGSFYLYNWTASGLFLRRDVSAPQIGSLRLVQNTSNSGKSAAQLIADEKCSAALDDTGEATALQSVSYSDTTWSLLFNSTEGSVFFNTELRQALAGIARKTVTVQICCARGYGNSARNGEGKAAKDLYAELPFRSRGMRRAFVSEERGCHSGGVRRLCNARPASGRNLRCIVGAFPANRRWTECRFKENSHFTGNG